MKLEIKFLLMLVALFILIQPVLLNAAVRPGDPGYKDPFIAMLLSFVLPGLGHLWVGERSTGMMYMIIGVGAYVFIFVLAAAVFVWSWWYILWLGLFAFEIWVALDAMRAARAHNSRGGRLAMVDHYSPAVVPVR
jgi:hypothetical protein